MKELLDIYRFRHGEKISSLRLMFFTIFGYITAGVFGGVYFQIIPYVLNTIVVFCGLLFASLLNDYYDHRYLREKNAVSNFFTKNILSRRSVFFLIWSPWCLAFLIFWLLIQYPVTPWAIILLWLDFILSFLYSSPPFRLKDRFLVGIVVSQIGVFLLFLQGFLLFGYPNQIAWVIAFFVFLFVWYLEFLHRIDDVYSGDDRTYMSIERSFFLLLAVVII